MRDMVDESVVWAKPCLDMLHYGYSQGAEGRSIPFCQCL